jgi:hypothetical protein
MKGRMDRSRGIEILFAKSLTEIKPTWRPCEGIETDKIPRYCFSMIVQEKQDLESHRTVTRGVHCKGNPPLLHQIKKTSHGEKCQDENLLSL